MFLREVALFSLMSSHDAFTLISTFLKIQTRPPKGLTD